MSDRDRRTRTRLLNAAARLFAERGFAKVTVRDICPRAHANVAAVNYHFGGKTGLYREVLQAAIAVMQSTTAAAREAGENQSPEEQLRAYVHVFLQRAVGTGQDTWIHQLMMRELSDPTPALDVVIDQVIRPRMAYLCTVVAKLLDCPPEDERVVRCAVSVHMQCLALMMNPTAVRTNPAFSVTLEALDEMAEHITRFSLAGIRAIALSPRASQETGPGAGSPLRPRGAGRGGVPDTEGRK